MQLTKQQIKKANKLLDLLCKAEHLGAEKVYSLFDSKNDAEYVCTALEKKQLLIVHRGGGKIYTLKINGNTCNAFTTNLLEKDLSSEKRIVLNSKLNIIVAILSIISAIVGFRVGILVSHSPKSNELSTIKANLDTCTTHESNLNHVVDSLKNENKILLEKVQTKLK